MHRITSVARCWRIGGIWITSWILCCFATLATARTTAAQKPLVLAHYMPWYVAKPHSQNWGWHWTMNHFDPEVQVDRRRQAASHHYPLAGCYDSGDPDVVAYHLQLMKLCGIDGVIVDWYGLTDLYDYATLHRNTSLLVDKLDDFGMKLVICYEDQTLPPLVKAGRVKQGEEVAHVIGELNWVLNNWGTKDSYVKRNGMPVLLSFGNAGLTNDQWTQAIAGLDQKVAYFSEHHRRVGAAGAFDWPIPDQGVGRVDKFAELSNEWPAAIPVVFPRFEDIYKEAGVNDGYVVIPDDQGKTFQRTWNKALQSGKAIVQIATWNDWGEGTTIEPSREFGYRDLEAIQAWNREQSGGNFPFEKQQLRLPLRLLTLKQSRADDVSKFKQIDQNLAAGNIKLAERQIEYLEKTPASN